jgi:hypothetical protein
VLVLLFFPRLFGAVALTLGLLLLPFARLFGAVTLTLGLLFFPFARLFFPIATQFTDQMIEPV